MVRTESFLFDRERSFVERLGISEAVLIVVQCRQIVEVRPNHTLPYPSPLSAGSIFSMDRQLPLEYEDHKQCHKQLNSGCLWIGGGYA
jgi:hypothetical protein